MIWYFWCAKALLSLFLLHMVVNSTRVPLHFYSGVIYFKCWVVRKRKKEEWGCLWNGGDFPGMCHIGSSGAAQHRLSIWRTSVVRRRSPISLWVAPSVIITSLQETQWYMCQPISTMDGATYIKALSGHHCIASSHVQQAGYKTREHGSAVCAHRHLFKYSKS